LTVQNPTIDTTVKFNDYNDYTVHTCPSLSKLMSLQFTRYNYLSEKDL